MVFWKPKGKTGVPAANGSAIDLAWRTLEANREWLAHADAKASTGLGITGVGITVVFAVVADQGVSGFWQLLTMSLVAVFGLLAIAFSLIALVARLDGGIGGGRPANPIYFGGVADGYATRDKLGDLRHAYQSLAADESALLDAITDQVRITSAIAKKKFTNVNREMQMMALALASAGAFVAAVMLG